MIRIASLVLALAAVSGCSKKERKLLPGATCPQAVANSMKIGLESQARDLSKLSAGKAKGLGQIVGAMAEHCADDSWSREAIECFAGAETTDNIGACKGTLTDAQAKGMEAAVDEGTSGAYERKLRAKFEATYKAEQDAKKVSDTRDLEKRLVALYPKWKDFMSTLHKTCPDDIGDFVLSGWDVTRTDGWEHELHVLCGATLPTGVTDVAFVSDGPDGHAGTDDDIKSW